MGDQPQRLSALAALCRNDVSGTSPAQAQVVLSERRGLVLTDLRGNPHRTEFLDSAATALGAKLPLAPNTSAESSNGTILWLGPDQWLLIGDGFSEALAVAGGFLTDVSHGRAAVRIGGPRARELLAKGCSLDLHARVFQPGHCAQTSIARTSVLLHALGPDDGFDLYCARSYAQSLWHWHTEAAAEFGYRVM